MLTLWRRLLARWGRACSPPLPEPLWQQTLSDYPFLARLDPSEQLRLRELSALFLKDKEFHGAQGLVITDAMALAIAAQACLPLLHLEPTAAPLSWYADFVGIVVHPDQVLARREMIDATGVVHVYQDILAGEAPESGPVMLSWRDVTSTSSDSGYNVVIHEFVHKLDMRDGAADGCPPLPANFMGKSSAREAREHWLTTLQTAYDDFREQVVRAARFGEPAPWLDAYGAESPSEFFAVCSEAYFVNRQGLAREMAVLLPLLDAWYRPPAR